MDAVLEDPGLRRTVKNLACSGVGNEQALTKKARRYFLEIASGYDEKWLPLWEKILSRLWCTIYDNFVVDQAGLAQIREIACRMPFVIIPCHRSHVDYLIFSYLLYKNNIPLPRVAAGDNMNFWPLGYVFRQSGAFFLRRIFQGNKLYSDVFATYIKHLLKDGVSVEFFLEGGRSRTGKMAAPRYGMVSILVNAYQENVCDDLALIPVSLGYDRLIEENSYMSELRGIPKKSESIWDLLKNIKVLGKRYGQVYMNVGAPIFLKSYFAVQSRPFAEMTGSDKQALYQDIGGKVISEINRISMVTPVSLVAASFLCHTGEEISGELLTSTFATFYDYLSYRKMNFAPALSTWGKALSAVLALFCDAGYISKTKRGDGQEEKVVYLLADEKRLNLEYYKNNIIHHFLPVSFVSACILACREKEISLSWIEEEYGFLKRTFRREFFFENDGDGEMAGALSYLKDRALLKAAEEKEVWSLGGNAVEKLKLFAGLIGSYIGSYRLAFDACSRIKGEEEWLSHVVRLGEERLIGGDIERAESLSQAYFSNALKFLHEEGIISSESPSDEETGEGVVSITCENRIKNLRFRLSNFV